MSNSSRCTPGISLGTGTLLSSDLPEEKDATTATFADENSILASDKYPDVATQKLQKSPNNVTKWFDKWRIKASISMSIHVTFTLCKLNCPTVQPGDTLLTHQDTIWYLGFHLDRSLTWRPHIAIKTQELKLLYHRLSWLLGRNSKLLI